MFSWMNAPKRISIVFWIIVIVFLLEACEISSAQEAPNTLITATAVATPGLTDTPAVESTPFQGLDSPLLPIDSTRLPDLLKTAYSIQSLNSLHGHSLRRITGWSYGYEDYGGKALPYYTDRYQWMDSKHLLLFPKIGVIKYPNWETQLRRAVVFNIETSSVWLPPEQPRNENRVLDILLPRWSAEAGVLISSETTGVADSAEDGVTTYSIDGKAIQHFQGKLVDISPTGNKILIDDTWIDLKSGKSVDFEWDFRIQTQRWLPAWSSDETRVYLCCYFYGDAATGESYSLTDEDNLFEGKPIDQGLNNLQVLHHSYGRWLNDTYVLAEADGFYTYMTGFELMIPLFDPAAKTYRDLIKLANLPDYTNGDIAPFEIDISPRGNYLWAHKPTYQSGFLVDLETLQSQEYPVASIRWSENGEYAIIDSKLLALSSKEIKAFPENVDCFSWHPTEGICASISTDANKKQVLTLLNAQTMIVQKVVLPTQVSFVGVSWSPKGDLIALTTEDNALWQINYPALNNLERLMLPITNLRIQSLTWSPDGMHLSFVDRTDIYVVNTGGNP